MPEFPLGSRPGEVPLTLAISYGRGAARDSGPRWIGGNETLPLVLNNVNQHSTEKGEVGFAERTGFRGVRVLLGRTVLDLPILGRGNQCIYELTRQNQRQAG